MNIDSKHKTQLLFLAFMMIVLSSCGRSAPQEESRYTRSEDIVVSSDAVLQENETELLENDYDYSESSDTNDPDSWLYRVSDPERYRGEPYEPHEYDFSLSFRDDMLVVNYGKSTVNVYQARYEESLESQNVEEWQFKMNSYPDFIDECQGYHSPLSRNEVLANFNNVGILSFSELNAETLAEKLGIDSNNMALCWTYKTGSILGVGEEIQYVPLSSQYIESIPIRRDFNISPVYEWSEDISLSRQCNYDPTRNWQGCYIDTDQTTFLFVIEERFSIGEIIHENLSVRPAEECLPEIKKAIIYNSFSHRSAATDPNKMDLYTVWETDVVVYCMELAYTVLDSTPLEWYDPHLETHELTIVPVWNVYYTATNSKTADENIVYGGTVMLNAVTGESIYSEMYGPEESEYLYPYAKDPG